MKQNITTEVIVIDSRMIYKLIRKRKKHSGKSYLDFVMHVRMIAKRAGMSDEKEVIQYAIDEITDIETNKAILYGPKPIKYLKINIKHYT